MAEIGQIIKDERDLPKGAREKTYGERIHARIFDSYLNFWVNLFASAAFTHWVLHSKSPFFGKSSPFEFHKNFTEVVRRNFFKSMEMARGTKAASVIADATALTITGNLVMIPSLWIGGKVKTSMVTSLDRSHYGKEAVENDEHIRYRHALLATSPRPTLLGAVIGRVGSTVAVQLSARFFGIYDNLLKAPVGTQLTKLTGINWLEHFPGVDYASTRIGRGIGSAMTNEFPSIRNFTNNLAKRANYGWSPEQVAAGATGVYNTALQDFTKYVALDTMYTAIASTVAMPIINTVKQVIPGLTYRPVPYSVYTPSPKAAPREEGTPSYRVSGIQAHTTLATETSRRIAP